MPYTMQAIIVAWSKVPATVILADEEGGVPQGLAQNEEHGS
jgi:hypothetical protein